MRQEKQRNIIIGVCRFLLIGLVLFLCHGCGKQQSTEEKSATPPASPPTKKPAVEVVKKPAPAPIPAPVRALNTYHEFLTALRNGEFRQAAKLQEEFNGEFATEKEKSRFLRDNLAVTKLVEVIIAQVCSDCQGAGCRACNGSKNCQRCGGAGKCGACGGTGGKFVRCLRGVCSLCNGQGLCASCRGQRQVTCGECNGVGTIPVVQTTSCPVCRGARVLRFQLTRGTYPCRTCSGTGQITQYQFNTCRRCDGKRVLTCSVCLGTGLCSVCKGKRHLPTCAFCSGQGVVFTACAQCSGSKRCSTCGGKGTCLVCGGTGQCPTCHDSGLIRHHLFQVDIGQLAVTNVCVHGLAATGSAPGQGGPASGAPGSTYQVIQLQSTNVLTLAGHRIVCGTGSTGVLCISDPENNPSLGAVVFRNQER